MTVTCFGTWPQSRSFRQHFLLEPFFYKIKFTILHIRLKGLRGTCHVSLLCLAFSDRGRSRGALQGVGRRDRDAPVVPVGPDGRRAQPAPAGRPHHRGTVLCRRRQEGAVRDVPAAAVRQILRVVFHWWATFIFFLFLLRSRIKCYRSEGFRLVLEFMA